MKGEEKVIIIGNSPSILLQEYGEQIDSYDIVIRINKCVTKGFEKYIGKKIDIWATTNLRQKKFGEWVPENYSDIRYLWKRTPKVKFKLPEDFPKVKEHTMYKTTDFSKRYRALLDEFNLKYEPCTGLLTILTSLIFYKDVTVHGFTFYTESENNFISGYYRESELSEDGTHPEDFWWSEQVDSQGKGFGSRGEGRKKQKLLNELIANGLDRTVISLGGDRIKINKIKESVPVKILNEDELGEMNL